MRGRPVLGVWTLADRAIHATQIARELRSIASVQRPSSAWQAANQSVPYIDVTFLLGAEPQSPSIAPAYLRTP